jgi:hypothetical protein
MITPHKIVLNILFFLFLSTLALSQSGDKKYNSKKYKKEPLWIEMMNDPKANYFETLKAFRLYWKDRVLPKEPFETEGAESFEIEVGLINDKESEKEREREEKKRAKQNKKGVDYSAEVRAFKGWMQGVKPWVKDDGTIMTEQERQSIVDKQQRELRELEIKNGKK